MSRLRADRLHDTVLTCSSALSTWTATPCSITSQVWRAESAKRASPDRRAVEGLVPPWAPDRSGRTRGVIESRRTRSQPPTTTHRDFNVLSRLAVRAQMLSDGNLP